MINCFQNNQASHKLIKRIDQKESKFRFNLAPHRFKGREKEEDHEKLVQNLMISQRKSSENEEDHPRSKMAQQRQKLKGNVAGQKGSQESQKLIYKNSRKINQKITA